MADKKNPFEIRTEILNMANDYLYNQYTLNLELTQRLIEEGKKTLDDLPRLHTPDDITKLAEQFYEFVKTKD